MIRAYHLYFILFVTILSSCEEYLDIEPVGQVIPKTIEEYRSFLTSAYNIPKNHKILSTYRTDEVSLQNNTPGIEQYADIFIWNDKNPSPSTRSFSYASFYKTIFYCNHVINNAKNIEGSKTEVDQLVGEAFSLRALQYFDLINLYAKPYDAGTAATDKGVPITTQYNAENTYPTRTVQEVYDLILGDIQQAESLLNVQKQPVGYNYRFSVAAIKSLKARVYLYQKKWQQVIGAVNEALTIQSELMNLNEDQSIMPSEYNSVESILALDEVSSFDLSSYAKISDALTEAYNKESDLRFQLYFRSATNGYSIRKNANPKYKTTFKTGELYLLLAEALAQSKQDNLAKLELVKFTKTRYTFSGWEAYKSKIQTLTNEGLLLEIYEERRRELAIEGHRWNDLRRTTQQEVTKIYDDKSYTLEENDDRYVIPFPTDAVINNPLIR